MKLTGATESHNMVIDFMSSFFALSRFQLLIIMQIVEKIIRPK